MGAGEDDVVERLYERLTDALERRRPRPYDTPVTVAEIYQELVPYRSVRTDAGFGMNAEYEHALLRLLAGELDLARIEPPHAREEILRELESVDPNVAIYRSYAGCDVWVRPPAMRSAEATSAGASPRPETRAPARQETRAPSPSATEEPVRPETRPPARPTVRGPAQEETPPPPAPAAAAGDPSARTSNAAPARRRECVACSAVLPAHRAAHYCAFCGAHQTTLPCASCGAEVEAGWSYCVECGTAMRRDAPGSP